MPKIDFYNFFLGIQVFYLFATQLQLLLKDAKRKKKNVGRDGEEA